jgi:hypothetical protein
VTPLQLALPDRDDMLTHALLRIAPKMGEIRNDFG